MIAAQAALAGLLALGAARNGAAAPSRFSLVIEGKIVTVEASGAGADRRVSARAVTEMARAAGASLSFDAESGVISVARGGGSADAELGGFKPGTPLSFVVDGKIVKVAAPRVVAGVPFLAPKDLKRVAEALGFSADLDSGAGLLALTAAAKGSASTASTPASGGGSSFGLDGSFMKGVAQGAGAAAGGASGGAGGGGGDVCSYMDGQKELWSETEPSEEEKTTLRGLASVFTEQQKKSQPGNPAQLQLLESTIRGFDRKVQRRLAGTRDSAAPEEAKPWQSVSVSFLENTQQVIDVSLDLIRIMKEPPERQRAEEKKARAEVDQVKGLQQRNQSIGTEQVEETIQVRLSHGCAPP